MSNIKHVALIMDGNRRWAKSRGLPSKAGHEAGIETLKKIVRCAGNSGISNITAWVLSTENISSRSQIELKHLFQMLSKIPEHLKEFMKEGVKIRVIGKLDRVPGVAKKAINIVLDQTKENHKMNLILAIDYGGRDEILRTISKIDKKEVDSDSFESALDTSDIPDPDLIIRTGGEKRLSGFMPWQSVYAELHFSDTLWPDYSEEEFTNTINVVSKRNRRFGS